MLNIFLGTFFYFTKDISTLKGEISLPSSVSFPNTHAGLSSWRTTRGTWRLERLGDSTWKTLAVVDSIWREIGGKLGFLHNVSCPMPRECVGGCKKCGTLHDFACHPCAGAMLIFSVSFQFWRMIPERNPRLVNNASPELGVCVFHPPATPALLPHPRPAEREQTPKSPDPR